MLFYRYFKPRRLPDPEGLLSETLSSTSMAANESVLAALKQQEEQLSKPGHYIKLTGVQQAQIAKYALSYGNRAAIHRYRMVKNIGSKKTLANLANY